MIDRSPEKRALRGYRLVVLVGWFTLLYAAAVGFHNGRGDQPAYLPLGLRIADPDFLPGDWFTWAAPHSHYAFGLLIAGVAKTGFLELGLTVGALVQSCGFAIVLFLGIRAAYDRPLLPWATALMLATSNKLRNPGASRLIPQELSASGLAGLACTAALALLLMDRPKWAGAAAGVAGLVHALYAVLLMPVMGIAALALWLRGRRADGLTLFGIYGVLSAPTVVRALSFGASPGVDEAQTIAREVFSVHLVPSSWGIGVYPPFLAPILVGMAGLFVLRPRVTPAFLAAVSVTALMVFVSLPLGYADVGGISTVWPWRLGHVLTLLGLVSAAAAATRPELFQVGDPLKAAAAITLLVAGATLYGRVLDRTGFLTIAVAASLPLLLQLQRGEGVRELRLIRSSILIPVGLLSVGFMPLSIQGVLESNYRLTVEEELIPVVDWIRTSTPRESVFASPPVEAPFRLAARRPTVGDLASTPWYPPARIAWRERIRELSGSDALSDWVALTESYYQMDCARALRLRQLYDVDFVLLRANHSLDCGSVAYDDDRFAVIDLRPSGSDRGG